MKHFRHISISLVFVGFLNLYLVNGVCGQSTRKNSKPTDYDYRSLAIDSVRDTVADTKKLPDIEQRVTYLISASLLLARSHKNEAIDLLDLALADVKEWESARASSLSRRFFAKELRNKILEQYLRLDKEKAAALAAADETSASTDDDSRPFKANGTWKKALLERQAAADKTLTIALSLLDTDPERAAVLAAESVEQGIVSLKLFQLFQKLRGSEKGALLLSLQERIAQTLRATVTLDSSSVKSASILAWDQDMTAPVRASFVQFLFKSLETWVSLSQIRMNEGELDGSFMDSMFVAFAFNVRPLILQHNSNEIGRFDVLLDQVSPQISAKTRGLIKTATTTEAPDAKDRLADISRESHAEKRDMRLLRFVVDMLRKDDAEDQSSLLADAVTLVNEPKLKANLNDLVWLVRVQRLAKTQKLNDAAKVAQEIVNPELRAWSLLALSNVVGPTDRFFAMTLINNAIKALETAASTPRRVEIALLAAGLRSKEEPVRALEILSLATKFANSVAGQMPEPNTGLASAIMYEVSIGTLKILPARPPTALTEIHIDSGIRLLAKKDWFGLQKMAGNLKDPALRVAFKLELAKGVIEEPVTKPTTAQSGSTQP